MVNWKSKKLGDLLLLANGLILIIFVNMVVSKFFFRLDLTEEKRYSIKEPTKRILKNLDDDVFIEVYLEGELNAEFRRFQKAVRETLEEFRIYSDNKLQYTFTNPSTALSQKARNEFMADLAQKGIQPTNVIDNKNGERLEKIIFPGAVISYGGAESGVMLLKGNKANSPQEEINQSIEGIEFELANALQKLTTLDRKQIGMITGHGELSGLQVQGLTSAISEMYDVHEVSLQDKELARYEALIIAKPTRQFSASDKYAWDQYTMQGGKTLILMDKLDASMDSASSENYFAFPYRLDLDDQLFKYGVRLNLDLVQDRDAAMYPVVTGQVGGKPKMQLMDWPFFPLVNHYAIHPITRNLDAVVTRFVSSIDTVKADNVKKTPLFFSSPYSRTVAAPVNVSINELRRNVKPEQFSKGPIPLAYLLEGRFTSLYKNRFLPEGADEKTFKDQSIPTKIIVIADGDLARNEVHPRTGQPQDLGFDPMTNNTFANKDLLMNMLAFLTDEKGLINARNKEIKIRPLDRTRTANEKLRWQITNLILPVVLLVAYGIVRAILRKRKYAAFS